MVDGMITPFVTIKSVLRLLLGSPSPFRRVCIGVVLLVFRVSG